VTPLTQFETKGLSELEFLEECFERDYNYQDYLTSAELCGYSPMSKRLFDGHMSRFTEQRHFATL
jgi:hypothetical protein